MKEEFLHYIWRYALYDSSLMLTTCGKSIEVIFAGQYNRDAGPDFLEAKLLIDNMLWVGHVEIHINSSDWLNHNHHLDPAYNPVILHVVTNANVDILNSAGVAIPTMELKIQEQFYNSYQELIAELRPIPCGYKWQNLSPVKVENAIVAMGIERIETRMNSLGIILNDNRGGWRELFLQTLCRGFGFGKNQHSMEALGKTINPVWVEKHNNNLFQLESIFFGQAGMLKEKPGNSYLSALLTEYKYLSRKYNMIQPLGLRWKYLRMRPGNFPPVRIAQLCSFLSGKENLIDQCLDIARSDELKKIDIKPSFYWKTHYDFDKVISGFMPEMGADSKLLLMINVFLPLNGFFNHSNGESDAIESWLDQLEKLPPENNNVTRQWEEIGFRIPNAFYSQSFLFIFRNYCIEKRCLECRIGQLIFGSAK